MSSNRPVSLRFLGHESNLSQADRLRWRSQQSGSGQAAKPTPSPDQARAQELYQDLVSVKAFVGSRDHTRDDRDKAAGSVDLQGVTQPLSQPFQHFVAHVRSVDAKSHSDGSMTIEAGRSSYHGQPMWPARSFHIAPSGDAQMREGDFLVEYRLADHQLYFSRA